MSKNCNACKNSRSKDILGKEVPNGWVFCCLLNSLQPCNSTCSNCDK